MTTTLLAPAPSHDDPARRRERALRLGLYGLLDNWEEIQDQPWVEHVLQLEEAARQRRSLERRLRNARCGRFKPMCDFDWKWPERVDREQIDELFTLSFVKEGANAVFIGPNGVGKSMIAKNLANEAVQRGYTVRFAGASQMLSDLLTQDGPAGLERRFRRYAHPTLLCVDEVGYLSYDSRHADLLFEVINRRQDKSTVVTTNRVFSEWNQVFPNSTSVVALIDRLIHRAEIVEIRGESYRLKEAKEREAERRRARKSKDPGKRKKSA
ncbi:MAG: ATP-binding protein [Planctomycetes bacterium]|nr:ATP-binding protein [Planctomycetota bacterium]